MKDAKIKHLREKNLRMEILLAEIITQYGDRPTHMDGLFKPEFQPELIARAMRIVGPEAYETVEVVSS